MTRSAHTRIFLTGFMGCGKSTLGPRIAERLGWPFLDLDTAVEERTGLTVPAIFASHGEPWFREREHEALAEACRLPCGIIALGGGAFIPERNRALIAASGVSVYLDATLDVLLDRLDGARVRRPFLEDEHGERLEPGALRAKASELMAERAPVYRLADLRYPIDFNEEKEQAAERLYGFLAGKGVL